MNAATTTALKNAEISRRIVAALATGLEMPAAFDSVMGEGAYMKLAGEVYSELRAKQGL